MTQDTGTISPGDRRISGAVAVGRGAIDRRGAPIGLMALAALGVVFGDLGTSPLYALQEAFHGTHGVAPSAGNVLGVVSLFLWSLILMVSIKYVAVLMRADNHGEGGILALVAILVGARGHPVRHAKWFVLLALFGTAMLYGDGVITPAISVLSAVEGLNVATSEFTSYVVPITIVILIGLFAIQPFGSGRVGRAFGPVLALWFVVIGILGAHSIAENPSALAAINPIHAVRFFANNGLHGFLALGAVVLCLTGGEALYADMGHFGARPIRLAWYTLALPTLVLSYLGQAAFLLKHPEAASRPFYSTVPPQLLYPMVGLATAATIIASQALIAAVFSLTRQAAQLGFAPRVQVVHTSGAAIGQIYLPGLNWLLLAATVGIVLIFRSSDRLAAAFGLAVSTTMAITTILFAAVARTRWHWSRWQVAACAGTFLIADLSFVAANAFKFRDGGWLPLFIGTFVFVIMTTWMAGRRLLRQATQERALPTGEFLESLGLNPPHRVRGTAVFLAVEPNHVPLALLHHLKHNQILHETVVLLTVRTAEVPRVPETERVEVKSFPLGFHEVIANYGYMDEPDIPRAMVLAASSDKGIPNEPNRTTYYLGRITVIPRSEGVGLMRRWRAKLFGLIRRNERSVSLYFGIPANRVIELGTRVEI
jgi:KUP system potassium uptake protein